MSHPLRDFARGKTCMVRLVGVCTWDDSTTVLAHIRRANVAGTSQKPPDTCAVWACEACHAAIDGRSRPKFDWDGLSIEALRELCEKLSIDRDILHALIRQLAWYDKHEILIVKISQGAAVRAIPLCSKEAPQSLSNTEVEMT